MTLYFRVGLVLATVLSAVACGQARTRDWPAQPSYNDVAAAESSALATSTDTIYQRRLRDLIRRSLLVPTDSLARLHGSIPTTADSLLPPLRQELVCEEWRLTLGHGHAAALRAIRRMADSLERNGVAFLRDQDRLLASGDASVSLRPRTCGVDVRRPRLPDSLYFEVFPTKSVSPSRPRRDGRDSTARTP